MTHHLYTCPCDVDIILLPCLRCSWQEDEQVPGQCDHDRLWMWFMAFLLRYGMFVALITAHYSVDVFGWVGGGGGGGSVCV